MNHQFNFPHINRKINGPQNQNKMTITTTRKNPEEKSPFMTNTNCQVLEDWPYQSPRSKNFSICCRLSALRMWPWLILDINISRVSQGHSWELGLCIFLENVSIGDETGNWVRFGVKSSWSIGRKWALTQERMSSDGQQEKPFISSLGNLPHAGAGCQPSQMQWNSPRPSCHVLTLVLWNSHSWVWNAEVEVVSCLSSMTVLDFFFLRQSLSWTRSSYSRLGWLPANWRNHFVSAWLLHLSAGESTSGSHTCAVSTFLNESPPRSLSQILGVLCIAASNPKESSIVK